MTSSAGSGGASTDEFRIKRNDTKPSLVAGLTERDPAATDPQARRPLNLATVVTVKLFARTRDARTRIGGDCSVLPADPDDPVWALHPELIPYPYQLRYDWTPTDTLRAALYLGEFEMTYGDGSIQTVPARGYFRIVIEEDQG